MLGELIGYTTFGEFSDRIGRKRAFTIFAWLMGGGTACNCTGMEFLLLPADAFTPIDDYHRNWHRNMVEFRTDVC